jgi:FkbM family methyltransferase
MSRIAAGIGILLVTLAIVEAQASATPPAATVLTGLAGIGLLVVAGGGIRAGREAMRQRNAFKSALLAARARSTGIQTRYNTLRDRAALLHHAVPEPDVLRGMLPLRAAAARARAGHADAIAREGRFTAQAPAYAAEIDRGVLPAERARSMTVDGLTWWVPMANPTDAAGADRNLAHQDFPYRAIVHTRNVSVGGLMLDLGANVGRMSIPRVLLGDVQAAYCAEPDPLNYACLVRNVVDNGLAGLVLPDQLAIGAANGTVRLHRARSAGGHRVLGHDAPTRGDIVDVPCLTLDTWVERLGIDLEQVAFIKIDVQGSELDVLRGAARVLACRHIAWQIEIDPATLAHRGQPVAVVYAELARHFTHAIDMSRHVGGERVRPIAELAEALAYLNEPGAGRTDVLLFSLHPDG